MGLPRITLVLFLACLGGPLAGIVLLALSASSAMETAIEAGFSLRWVHALFSDQEWTRAAIWTLGIGITSALFATAIGISAAFLSTQKAGTSIRVVKGLLVAPLFIPPVVLAMGLYVLLDQFGLFDTFIGTVLAHQAAVLPVVYLILRARFEETSVSLYEMARLLGASSFKAMLTWLWNVQRGTVAVALIVGTLISANEVVITLYVTDTHIQTLTRRALSGVARDISPEGFAFVTLWWIFLLTGIWWIRRFRLNASEQLGEAHDGN